MPDVARLIRGDADKPEDINFNHVAAGNAVLAAIAASHAVCCRLLGERSRGQDHRDAIALLEQVRFGPARTVSRAGTCEKARWRRSQILSGKSG